MCNNGVYYLKTQHTFFRIAFRSETMQGGNHRELDVIDGSAGVMRVPSELQPGTQVRMTSERYFFRLNIMYSTQNDAKEI